MMLCGVSVVFNSLGDVIGLMSCKRSSENGQVLVGFQSTEAFGCLSMPAFVSFCSRCFVARGGDQN
jgi:hypothetical protein